MQIHLKLQLSSQPIRITLHDSKTAAHECYFFAQNILFVVKHKLYSLCKLFQVGFPFFRELPSAGWRYPSAKPPKIHNFKSPALRNGAYRPMDPDKPCMLTKDSTQLF